MRETLCPSAFAAQIEPAPTVTADGEEPRLDLGGEAAVGGVEDADRVGGDGGRGGGGLARAAARDEDDPGYGGGGNDRRGGCDGEAAAAAGAGSGAERREVVPEALDHELVEALGLVDVLQPLLAQVAERRVGRQLVPDERGGGRGEEHLATVRGGGDPRALVEAEAVIALVADLGLAGVEAHADAALGALGPVVRGERALRVGGRGDGVAGAGEGVEERVALRVHLAAAVRREGLAEEAAVVGEQVAVARAELLQQARRALDVGEQHRHRARRESATLAHPSIRTPLAAELPPCDIPDRPGRPGVR